MINRDKPSNLGVPHLLRPGIAVLKRDFDCALEEAIGDPGRGPRCFFVEVNGAR